MRSHFTLGIPWACGQISQIIARWGGTSWALAPPRHGRLTASTCSDGVSASIVRQIQDEIARSRPAAKDIQPEITSTALANAARELEQKTQINLPPEGRGREPDRECLSRKLPAISRKHINNTRHSAECSCLPFS